VIHEDEWTEEDFDLDFEWDTEPVYAKHVCDFPEWEEVGVLWSCIWCRTPYYSIHHLEHDRKTWRLDDRYPPPIPPLPRGLVLTELDVTGKAA